MDSDHHRDTNAATWGCGWPSEATRHTMVPRASFTYYLFGNILLKCHLSSTADVSLVVHETLIERRSAPLSVSYDQQGIKWWRNSLVGWLTDKYWLNNYDFIHFELFCVLIYHKTTCTCFNTLLCISPWDSVTYVWFMHRHRLSSSPFDLFWFITSDAAWRDSMTHKTWD